MNLLFFSVAYRDRISDVETIRMWWSGLPPKIRGEVWYRTLNTNVPFGMDCCYLYDLILIL
jgi:hypothetical protein